MYETCLPLCSEQVPEARDPRSHPAVLSLPVTAPSVLRVGLNNTPQPPWALEGAWPGSGDPLAIWNTVQLPNVIKPLALSALSFPLCALRPLPAGTLHGSLGEHFHFQVRQGVLLQARKTKCRLCHLCSPSSPSVPQGAASCHQGFLLQHVDSGLSVSAPPHQHASVLSTSPPGASQVCPPLYSPRLLHSPHWTVPSLRVPAESYSCIQMAEQRCSRKPQ